MKELNVVEICRRIRASQLVHGNTLKVHSAFPSAVNIIGDDVFISLLSDRHCLFPMSCRVANDIPFTEYGIRKGMEVIASSDRIIIPKAELVVNLKDSMERDLSFDKKEGLLVPEDLVSKVEILKELIREKGCQHDLSTLVTGKYRNPYADLVMKKLPGLNKAIKISDLQAGEQAGGLAGCGIGLTPSSDDMLIGYMSAYLADSKAKGYSSEDAYKVTNAMGNKAAERTNIISGTFLKQCGMGLLSDDMTKLMCALYSASEAETVRNYGQRIQNFGSTSGTDMLTGVVLAIVNLTDR
jgi:hypothetical protein